MPIIKTFDLFNCFSMILDLGFVILLYLWFPESSHLFILSSLWYASSCLIHFVDESLLDSSHVNFLVFLSLVSFPSLSHPHYLIQLLVHSPWISVWILGKLICLEHAYDCSLEFSVSFSTWLSLIFIVAVWICPSSNVLVAAVAAAVVTFLPFGSSSILLCSKGDQRL